jgi:aspartate/tyrosine/aromatic aminotransferase
MSILSNDALTKENKGNALAIGAEARKAKALDNSIIDSTIGMLYDEEGKFFTFKTVERASCELSGREKYSYGATCGTKEFHEALYHWIFRQYYDEFKENIYLGCIATPGGTGAICNTFANYLEDGQKVLLPDYMWTNYIQVAREEHLGYTTFHLFDSEGNFNLSDFEDKCLSLKEEQGRIVVVINDPCENPTGYSMSYTDWIGVVEVLNRISRDSTPVVLIYEMAYIDYDKRGFDASRNNIRLFEKLTDSVLTIMCFSGSKTLGLYGLRIGAQIAIAHTEKDIIEFNTANDFSARGKWSGASTLGQNIIVKVLTSFKDEFAEELEYARRLLINRADAFIEEAKSVGLKHLPYSCGFFVTIPVDNPLKAFEDLKKAGLYVLPIQNAIRLTLSSITLEEVKRAVHIIKENI